MNRKRPGLGIALALLLVLPAFEASAQDEAGKSGNASGVEAGEVEEAATPTALEKDLERFRAFAESRRSSLDEASILQAEATRTSGFDARALRLRAYELRKKGRASLLQMGEIVRELNAEEGDVSAQTAEFSGLPPSFWKSIGSDLDLLDGMAVELREQRSGLSDPEALSAYEARAARHAEEIVELLRVGVRGLELSEELGVPAKVEREWIGESLLARARLTGSHLHLAFEALRDLGVRADAGGDPAVLAPIEAAGRHRVDQTSSQLRSILELMERVELDTTAYQQLLVEATGEIVVGSIDRDIMREIFSEWTTKLRDSVASSAPGAAFSVILFLVIMAAFYWISRLVRNVVERAVAARHLRLSELLKRTVVSLSSGAVVVVGFLIALSQLGIEIAPMLAGLGIAGFVIGFALQDTLGNFAAGLMILLYRPYDVGDMIDCAGGVFGQVSHMSLVSTTILTIDNKTLIVPNSKIWGDVITNVTAQRIRRVDLEFGIGYADDIPKAERVLEEILAEHPKILDDPEPVVKLHSLGDSSVNFVVRPWVATDDYWDIHWDVTREVKLRFDREGVSIPFPQRDVHFYPADVGDADPEKSAPGDASVGRHMGSTAASLLDEPNGSDD